MLSPPSTRYTRVLLSALLVVTLGLVFRVTRRATTTTTTTMTTTTAEMMHYGGPTGGTGFGGSPTHVAYSAVKGFFLQGEKGTDAETFDYVTMNLGLIDRPYDSDAEFDPGLQKTQWQRFENQVAHLRRESGPWVRFKVLYLGRHGQGYHNVAESYYGKPAWNCYWSLHDGNGTITWADANLTFSGVAQARRAHGFWAAGIATHGIPPPQSYYTSPLTRCLETARLTFTGLLLPPLLLPSRHPFVPVVKELLRETIGVHTCDRRSPRSQIHRRYPDYRLEADFSELDPLWNATHRETPDAEDQRVRTVLDNLFTTDNSTYISFTTHSGVIEALLRVLGHRPFSLATGGIIPVLVKAERLRGPAPSSDAPYTSISTCATPPPPTSKPTL